MIEEKRAELPDDLESDPENEVEEYRVDRDDFEFIKDQNADDENSSDSDVEDREEEHQQDIMNQIDDPGVSMEEMMESGK